MPALLGWLHSRWTSWSSERTGTELRLLALVLAIAAVLRIIWVLYAMREPQGVHDPAFYFGFGQSIADGGGYHLPTVGSITAGSSAYYPIGYPAMLGALYFIVNRTPIPDDLVLATGFLQVFLGVVSVALVYGIGRRLSTPTVGLLAALWLALFPNLIFHTGAILTETLFIFLVLSSLAVLFSYHWRDERPGWRLVGFGVLLGLSALVRPIALLLLPLLPIAWLVGGYGWRRAFGYAGAVLVVTAATIMPWTIRNAIQMDAFVIISANMGDNLCIGHHPNAPGHFALPGYCFAGDRYVDMDRSEFETTRNSDNIRNAIDFVLDNPIDELQLLSRKAVSLWEHDHDGLRAVESYGDDPFIGTEFSLVINPDQVPEDQFFFILQGIERHTGLKEADLAEQVLAAQENGVDQLVIVEDLDEETARKLREEVLFGVEVKADSSLRAVFEGIADVYFFVTISIGGLGLVGLVLGPRDPRRIYLLLGLLAFAGIPLVFFGDARFHVPVMPFLVIPAAWAVVTSVQAVRERYVS
jgi:hypothetical protein